MTEYNFQERASEVDKLRRDAANSGNALQYAICNIELGIEPEEQYLNLHIQGLNEIQKNSTAAEKLEYRINKILYGGRYEEKEFSLTGLINISNNIPSNTPSNSKNSTTNHTHTKQSHTKEEILAFLKEARTYNPEFINRDSEEKKRLLKKYFQEFRTNEKNDLNKALYLVEPYRIGVKFKQLFDAYEKKYSKDKI
jgi:hypothetical protein